MSKIKVDAYDCRHPEHEKFVDFQCDTGLDITLHPGFIVEIDVAEPAEISLKQTYISGKAGAGRYGCLHQSVGARSTDVPG
jgi:hypothetical protein